MRRLKNIFVFVMLFVGEVAFAEPTDNTETFSAQENPSFAVSDNQIDNYEDLVAERPLDLQTPNNVKTEVEFDPTTGCYIIRTKVGDMEISSPFMLSPEEYQNYTLEKEMQENWRKKNSEKFESYDSKFSLTDIKFNIGPADKILVLEECNSKLKDRPKLPLECCTIESIILLFLSV